MKPRRNPSSPPKRLRARAERLLGTTGQEVAQMPVDDVQKLVHELQVHQIELEMQNDELRRTHLELQAARDQFVELYDLAPVGYVTLDADGVIQQANLTAASLLGLSRDSLISKKLASFLTPESQDAFYLHRKTVAASRSKQACELQFRRKDGTRFFGGLESVAAEGRPHLGKKSLVAISDHTAQKQAEAAIVREQMLMRTTMDLIPGPFFVKDRQRRFLLANDYCAQMVGASSPDELLGKTEEQFYPQALAARIRAKEDRVMASGEALVDNEEETSLRDGGKRFLITTKLPFRNPEGKVIGLVGIGHDIQERKQAEEALKAREAQLYSFVQQAPAAIAMFDRNMNYLAISQRWKSDFHRDQGDPIGLNHYAVHPLLPERWKKIHLQGLAGESLANDEDLWVQADGRRLWVRWSVSPWLDAHGEIGGIMMLAEDITARKEAEEALQESEEKLRFALETIHTGAWDLDLVDHTTFRSIEHDRIFGYEALLPEWTYEIFLEHVLPEDRATVAGKFQQAIESRGDWNFECRIRRADGEIRWIWAAGRHRKDAEGAARHITGIVQDISERKRADERITQLNRAQAILGGVDHAIVHIADQRKLLNEICRVAVEKGGFKLAWVGMVAPDGSVQPVANAGATGYLKGIRVVTPDLPEGRGPVGTALRENRPVVIEDIDRDQRMTPWRDRALKFGLRFVAAFPIRISGQATGTFQVYAPRADFFIESELGLLTQVSDDISYALTAISVLAARNQAEEALRQSEARFKLIFDTIPIGIAFHTIHPDGSFTRTINDAHLRLCGITREQHNEPEIHQRITHPDDFAIQQKFQKRVHAGALKHFSMEKRYLRPGGRIVWVDFSYQREVYPDGTIEELTAVVDITARKQMEESLRRSEHNLSIFFNEAPIGLLWLSASGTILRANQAHLDMLGYPAEDFVGHYFLKFCTNPEHGRQFLERLANKETVRNFPMTRRCKDGTVRHVLVDANSFWSEDHLQYSSIFVRDITDRVKLEREILQVTDREQRRIAQDLHDGLGQLLAGTAYLAGILRQKLAAKSLPEARQLGRIQEVINEAIAQTRSLARGLHPVEPEPNGLMAALQALAARTKKLFHVRCHLHCPQPVLIQNNIVATHLFRIAQEAITNAIKHGKPKRIEISLTETPGRINLAIKDNGAGIPARPQKPGMGLRIMRYRAGMIGGSLAIQKEADGGTTIVCAVHLSGQGDAAQFPKAARNKKNKKD